MKNLSLSFVCLLLCTAFAHATPFITRWDLSKVGSGANQIKFNATTTGTVAYTLGNRTA